jgi:D-alanyl-D-alanine carboxypeptidase
VRSVFRVGSITKQFTSAAILQLVQEGTLAVSDSVGHWLPDLPAAWRPVTISQLLNHTSGIPS